MAKHHVKWVTLVGVVLMLLALTIYLLSIDESEPDEPRIIERSE